LCVAENVIVVVDVVVVVVVVVVDDVVIVAVVVCRHPSCRTHMQKNLNRICLDSDLRSICPVKIVSKLSQ